MKIILTIFIILIVLGVSISRLTRKVPPFEPPKDRQLVMWGSLDRETAQKLQSILDENVNHLQVPGLQAFVRTSDGQTWSGTSGTIDLGREIPLQRDSILRIGSVTKTFTAVIILNLVEEGHLDLDTPIKPWFPELPNAETITVRHLLNHSSGIPEIIPKVMMRSVLPWTYWESEELVKIAIQDQPLFSPGNDFSYSNTNYILLGLIAEAVSGKTTTQLLHEQIIDPLRLEHTTFIPYEEPPPKLVPGFDRDFSSFPGMLEIGVDNTSWATSAFTSGALASTAEDLGLFFESLFNGTLLSPAMLDEMTAMIAAPNPGFPEQTGYGLGLMRLEVDGQVLLGHAGQFMGSTSIAMVSPEEKYLITITTNLSQPDLVEVLADIQAIIQ